MTSRLKLWIPKQVLSNSTMLMTINKLLMAMMKVVIKAEIGNPLPKFTFGFNEQF